ncbi:indolepyruvate ferredoxin oxidoreductase family protein [Pseudomonas sp. HN11]|uniref:indolepyruvate ferredoxin oxidoreductase family protein n=1 Tax=Pseudomonas sp. HN11 TaxID=1344094 RepID=UPI001F44DEC9|nr:indolepyruvate ferredoxin oxidoreductase family protein [Pseudomonas sp. HN11]UII69883.1 indolepyruvate ferredoxin oxidoreductase family protein [Pseudomonas sp. HN11]
MAQNNNYGLEDIYSQDGRVFISGIQALVRLPIMQRRLDRARGLNTAGLVSGYRGSPLGAYDQQLWRAARQLKENDIVFQPGLNEDLAATALWGAQMHRAFGPTKVDGVFGIWYGKGPGVDRTGDVFRSANVMGTSKLGGVLAVSGDDHAAQSSMYPHQTDGIFQSASMPVLQPASVAEVVEFGLAGIELSRFSGLWVGLKTIAEVVEAAAVVDFRAPVVHRTPLDEDPGLPSFNWDPRVIWPNQRYELERRVIELRLPAARRWAHANGLDKILVAAKSKRIGIVTVGKAHQDLMQALVDLRLSTATLQTLGVSIYKVAMSWPLETVGMTEFARDHEELLVIEEKRGTVEGQIKEALFHISASSRPRVIGKQDPDGRPLLPEVSEFSPLILARVLVDRLGGGELRQRLAELEALSVMPASNKSFPVRTPYFCSGCPHNTSTRTPDGSISGGGIGCHVMALMQPELKTNTFCQMGGEGMQWAGAQAFSQTQHIFQNLGDGTYQHSGLLAIRAALALGTNITYKILYNDAVAMTGGQPAEGVNDPARITRQLHAEGVKTVVLVSDQPGKWVNSSGLAPGVEVHHRDKLDTVQRRLRDIPGVTAIVYEQTCAAEKRRRKKKAAPSVQEKRLLINPRVCEGCGDCSVQSNCIAIEPLETSFGRKRAINQTSCNTDMSCLKGFCPSFVEIEGGRLAKPSGPDGELERLLIDALVPPKEIDLGAGSYNVMLAGIGGTGVLTVGALLGMAALLDGKVSNVLDFTGFAQKNGAVLSQVKISSATGEIFASRISPGEADLLIGADLVVSCASDISLRLSPNRTSVVLSTEQVPTAQVIHFRDATQPIDEMTEHLRQRTDATSFHALSAGALAKALFGDTTTVHVLLLGYAWQKGLLPLSLPSLERAIELNGVAPQLNKRAFSWGRIAATNPDAVAQIMGSTDRTPHSVSERVEDLVSLRHEDLTAYQDAAYAKRYSELVDAARAAESRVVPGSEKLAAAVAKNAYKLMAYKDEYEVARLYASADFKKSLSAQFTDVGKLSVWLAPPLFARLNPATGRPRKMKFGPWAFKGFALLAALKGLRGTLFDPFSYTRERADERALIIHYFRLVHETLSELNPGNYEHALQVLQLPDDIRGFGPVKQKSIEAYYENHRRLMARKRATPSSLITSQA